MINILSREISLSLDEEQHQILEKNFYRIRDTMYDSVMRSDFALVHIGGFRLEEINNMSIIERKTYLELLREVQEKKQRAIEDASSLARRK